MKKQTEKTDIFKEPIRNSRTGKYNNRNNGNCMF